MDTTIRQRLQVGLVVLFLAAGIRLWLIYRERNEPITTHAPSQSAPMEQEAYVVPKKLHAYDLKSARELIGRRVWVRTGYGITYYPFNPGSRRSDFGNEAGVLGPIEQLDIQDVVLDPSPTQPQWQGPPNARFRVRTHLQEVMAVFTKDGKSYAFPIGSEKDSDYSLTIDDEVYIQDPHQLYDMWPANIWQAIEHREVRLGMTELQASFAVGIPEGVNADSDQKTVHYNNNGRPLSVVYENGRAASVTPEQPTAKPSQPSAR
jgi:hypothetical protein